MKLFAILMMAVLSTLSVPGSAQDTAKQKPNEPRQKVVKTKYSCPMHPDVTSDKAGTCPACGMELKKSKKGQMKMEIIKTYSCPMKCEGDKTYNKPGKCSVCGMALKEKEKKTVAYSCPMKCEGDKIYDKPGKCPVCGMALKEKEKITVAYSCPMKCEGDKIYDKPGKCPVCGMNLKEKKDDHSGHQH